VYNEQRDNSQKKINTVIGTSIGIAIVLYEGIAVMGYLSFGKAVMGNIILECRYRDMRDKTLPCICTDSSMGRPRKSVCHRRPHCYCDSRLA
jgi:hypothetical protein